MNEIFCKYKKFLFLPVGVFCSYKIFLWLKNAIKNQQKTSCDDTGEKEMCDVIFFPELSSYNRNPAGYKWSKLSELLSLVSGTQTSLDMCLYLVTLPELANIAIRLHQTGVRVRLVVEASNVGISGCQVRSFLVAIAT